VAGACCPRDAVLHRWWGNPMFSFMVRRMFHAPIHDVYCGMRGFTKAAYDRLDMRCTGMEFATEMIIKASRYKFRIAEVPITPIPTGARRTRHTSRPSAMGGERCGFS